MTAVELAYRPLLDCPWCLAPLPLRWLRQWRWTQARRGGCPECMDVVRELKARHRAARAARVA